MQQNLILIKYKHNNEKTGFISIGLWLGYWILGL